MSTLEKIKNASDEQLDNMFCALMEAVASRVNANETCEICPLASKCTKGSAGFVNWLKETKELNFKEFIIGL